MFIDEDPRNIMISKAVRVLEAGLAQRLPKNRSDLKSHIEEIRRRIRFGRDKNLAALGFTSAGLQYYFRSVCGASQSHAQLLADASATLVNQYHY